LEQAQQKNPKIPSALTYDFYCFKNIKITLLWQKPTIEKKFNAGHFFIFFISEEYILKLHSL